jgi:Mor family transcriptional regulator
MYVNAEKVLPKYLLRQIQQYVQGVELYIPKQPETRMGWGERNGTRRKITERNREIVDEFLQGKSIHALMEKYHLGYDSIRKIVSPYRKE